MVDFRPVYRALAKRLEEDLTDKILEFSRKNLPAGGFKKKPGMLILENAMIPIRDDADNRTEPIAWHASAILVIYYDQPAGEKTPGDKVLDLVSLVADALEWHEGEMPSEDGHSTTLGGVVEWARIEEVRITDTTPDLSQVSVVIEVTMEVPT